MNDRTEGNGAVLGIAAVAAGVVGTVAAALMNRGNDDETRQDIYARLRDAGERSRSGAQKSRKRMKKEQKRAPKEVEAARQRLADIGSEVSRTATTTIETARSRIDSGDLQGASQRLAATLKDKSREGASRAESAGSDVAARASALASDVRSQLPGLKERAEAAAIDVKDRGVLIGDQLRENLPEIRERVESKVTPLVIDARAHAKPLLDEAVGAAATTLGIAGTKAHDARQWAEKDAFPEVRDTLAEVAHKVAKRAKNAESVLASVSSDASERLSGVGETIDDRSRQVATAAAKGTKDTGSLVFWTVVGAGIVFYAFLSEEQREQVKSAAQRIGSEAREIYRDIQGYDEEFA